jgi:hypothetical protein
MTILDRFLARDQEREAIAHGDLELAEILRQYRRNRIISVIGLACALVMITLSLAQVFGLVSRPMPLALWVVFGAAFFVVMLINIQVLRKHR